MSLCTVCLSIDLHRLTQLYSYHNFHPEGRKKINVGYPHHRTYADLAAFAITCPACALFFQSSNADPKYPNKPGIQYDDTVTLSIKTGDGWPRRYLPDPSNQQRVMIIGLQVRVGPIGSNVISYDKVLDLWVNDDASRSLKCLVISRPVKAVDDVSTIQNWLGICLANHHKCRMDQRSTPESILMEAVPLPTRVLDVGVEGNNSPQVHLVESRGQKAMYLTLSHCWGSDPISTTTKLNVRSHKAGIDIESLSLNFRHAITFTRRLGFRYLWIDSLCIIQDNTEDWEIESSKMAEIYHQSALTISAANSSRAGDGFLKHRVSSEELGVKIPIKDGILGKDYFYIGPPSKNYSEDVDNGPLYKRGWTLQERVLSRRNVFFGVHQSHWECKTARFSENTPLVPQDVVDISGGVSSFRSLYSLPSLLPVLPAGQPCLQNIFPNTTIVSSRNTENQSQILNLWYHLVGEFTKRDFTFGDDKLPALSGIVSVFGKALGGHENTYATGIWVEDFERGLLWKNFGPTVATQRKMRSPSWSWSCVDGPVQLAREMKDSVRLLKSASCEIGYTGKDKFGRVDFGKLFMKGQIRKVDSLERTGPDFQEPFMYVLTNAVLKDHLGREIGAGYLDEPSCGLGKEDVFCVPIRHSRDVGLRALRVDCLLLCKMPTYLEMYSRVGTATLSIMGSDLSSWVAPFQEFLATAVEKDVVII
ncbi:heterokaryon incompatibility protein-domain-containing protein [Bisporella sp. PMI_857]|nr:heterokaryon incompatibility protein-domain-containing protein [Bisporella sp. PMI_857]